MILVRIIKIKDQNRSIIGIHTGTVHNDRKNNYSFTYMVHQFYISNGLHFHDYLTRPSGTLCTITLITDVLPVI